MYTLLATSLFASAPVPKLPEPPCVQAETVEIDGQNAARFYYSVGREECPIHSSVRIDGKRVVVGGYCWFPDGSYPGAKYRVEVSVMREVKGEEKWESFTVPIGEAGEWSWETVVIPVFERGGGDHRFPEIMQIRVQKAERAATGDRWVAVTDDRQLHLTIVSGK